MARKEYFTDSDNPDKVLWGFGWRGTLIATVLAVLCIGGGWAIWHMKVFTSEYKGAGDAKIEINSGKNRLAAQERFVALYNAIQKQDKDIEVLAATLKRKPNEFNQTNYDAAIMTCNTVVAEYNAFADQARAENWRPENLPYQIDTTDSRFDCKETSK